MKSKIPKKVFVKINISNYNKCTHITMKSIDHSCCAMNNCNEQCCSDISLQYVTSQIRFTQNLKLNLLRDKIKRIASGDFCLCLVSIIRNNN